MEDFHYGPLSCSFIDIFYMSDVFLLFDDYGILYLRDHA